MEKYYGRDSNKIIRVYSCLFAAIFLRVISKIRG